MLLAACGTLWALAGSGCPAWGALAWVGCGSWSPGWGDRALFQLGNGLGNCRSLPLPVMHEEEWCAVSRSWVYPAFLTHTPPSP